MKSEQQLSCGSVTQNGQCYRDGLYTITWGLEKLFGPQSDYVEKKST